MISELHLNYSSRFSSSKLCCSAENMMKGISEEELYDILLLIIFTGGAVSSKGFSLFIMLLSMLVLILKMFRLVTQQSPECKAVLQEVTQLVEEKLASNSKAFQSTFGATQLKIDGDFLYFLEEVASIAFQYGNPDKLCTPMTEAKKAGEDLVVIDLQISLKILFSNLFYINKEAIFMEKAYAKYMKEYYIGS
ncbi:unnamed protein product [Lactuca virosa]|uniref:Uncharacterized protein n=1 Tax=Lactuca virosa TaxID=75947 RepID=A0AAU9LGK4_9ASTR|nr:unnamed protein product [Lactuca virosa]